MRSAHLVCLLNDQKRVETRVSRGNGGDKRGAQRLSPPHSLGFPLFSTLFLGFQGKPGVVCAFLYRYLAVRRAQRACFTQSSPSSPLPNLPYARHVIQKATSQETSRQKGSA